MCKYCERTEQNKGSDNYLIDVVKDFGVLGEMHCELIMFKPTDQDPKLGYSIWLDNDIPTDENLVDEYIPISYCPFCGRKLEESE